MQLERGVLLGLVLSFAIVAFQLTFVSSVEGDIGVCFYDQYGNPMGDCANDSFMIIQSPINNSVYEFFEGNNYELNISIITSVPAKCSYGGQMSYGDCVGEDVTLCPIFLNDNYYDITSELSIEHYTEVYAGSELQEWGFSCTDANNNTEHTSILFRVIKSNITEENRSEEYQILMDRIENLESRVGLLESWKTTITTQLSNIVSSITGLVTRVEVLEETPCSKCNETTTQTGAGTWENFKNYITSSTRKNMVCGYAEENRLNTISDLGYNCDLTYKTLSSGKESVSCKCKKL